MQSDSPRAVAPCTDPRFVRNPNTGQCDTCSPNWRGGFSGRCDYCRNDQGCVDLFDNPNASCNQGLTYSSRSSYKQYSCDVSDLLD